jgi:hypothetical protein
VTVVLGNFDKVTWRDYGSLVQAVGIFKDKEIKFLPRGAEHYEGKIGKGDECGRSH